MSGERNSGQKLQALVRRFLTWRAYPCRWCGKKLRGEYVMYHPSCLTAKASARTQA